MTKTNRTRRWLAAGWILGAALLLGTSAQAMDDVPHEDPRARALEARFVKNLRRAENAAARAEGETHWRQGAFYRQGVAIPGITRATGFRWAATPRSLAADPNPARR